MPRNYCIIPKTQLSNCWYKRFSMTRRDALCSNVYYERRKFMNGWSKCPSAVTYRDACDVTRGLYVTQLSTESTEIISNVELTTLASCVRSTRKVLSSLRFVQFSVTVNTMNYLIKLSSYTNNWERPYTCSY